MQIRIELHIGIPYVVVYDDSGLMYGDYDEFARVRLALCGQHELAELTTLVAESNRAKIASLIESLGGEVEDDEFGFID